MLQANPLRLMLDRTAIDNGMLELFKNRLVDGITLGKVSKLRYHTLDERAYEIFDS
jgi:hypothetical protein